MNGYQKDCFPFGNDGHIAGTFYIYVTLHVLAMKDAQEKVETEYFWGIHPIPILKNLYNSKPITNL